MHPLSPLLHGAKSLVVIVAALSWQTLGQVGFGRFVGLVVVLTLVAIGLSLVSWLNTGYHVVGRELRIYEGLVWRRTRAIPLERLQAVDVIRPFLARLTGLAELRLEVVGGGKTEAPLAYLTTAEANALRERLLHLAGQLHLTPTAVAAPTGRQLHVVRNQDLLISQLLTPQTFSLPIGVAVVLHQFLAEGASSFIAVASTITATAGIMFQPIRRVFDDWNFRLTRDGSGLRLRRGLVETRTQNVPLNRLQAVTVTWPLLWRLAGWVRLRMDVAGYAGPDQGGSEQVDRLLPVGDPAVARRIVAQVLPGVDLAALPLTPPPARVGWLRPLTRTVLGAGLSEQVFAARHGLLTRHLVVVPYARIQSVRVVQGPLQRLLGVATVYADAAGGSGAAALHRDLTEAWRLAAELADRARAARS
ncbi:MAG TPA: PH domain-containing protein [Micromonosporaceae bacterium]